MGMGKLWPASLLVLLMSDVTNAHAAESYHTGILKFVYPLGDGSYVIGFTTQAAACTNANSPKYHYISVGQNGVTGDGLRNIVATALMVFASAKNVTVAFDDASAGCHVNRLTVSD